MQTRQRLTMPRTAAAVTVLVADIVFFGSFNPRTGSSFIVILGCALLAVTSYLLVRLVISVVGIVIPMAAITQKRLRAVLVTLIIFLVLMQSIGQLSRRDLLAVLPLSLIAYFYISFVGARSSGKTGRQG